MDIQRAKSLKIGSIVHCPADRGDLAFIGKVVSVGEHVRKNLSGTEYVWIHVRHTYPGKRLSAWPSNRLG